MKSSTVYAVVRNPALSERDLLKEHARPASRKILLCKGFHMDISLETVVGKLNAVGYDSFARAFRRAMSCGHRHVELSHWLEQMLARQNSDLDVTADYFRLDRVILAADVSAAVDRLPRNNTESPMVSGAVIESLDRAWHYSTLLCNSTNMRTGHVLIGILNTRALRDKLFEISREFRRIDIEALGGDYRKIWACSDEENLPTVDGSTATGKAATSAGEQQSRAEQPDNPARQVPRGRAAPGPRRAMAHDVFLSYSSKDNIVAEATCAVLERNAIPVWMAPRDVLPGEEWGEAIVEAIGAARLVVVVFSGNANDSRHVRLEIERAINRGLPVLPFRIEDIAPRGSLELFLGASHWLNAFTEPLERHLDKLQAVVKQLLQSEFARPTASSAGAPGSTEGRRERPAPGPRQADGERLRKRPKTRQAGEPGKRKK